MEGQSLSAKSQLVWIIARDCQFSNFLVFFSRKENKGEIVFETLLKKKKKSPCFLSSRGAGENRKNLAILNILFHRGETN